MSALIALKGGKSHARIISLFWHSASWYCRSWLLKCMGRSRLLLRLAVYVPSSLKPWQQVCVVFTIDTNNWDLNISFQSHLSRCCCCYFALCNSSFAFPALVVWRAKTNLGIRGTLQYAVTETNWRDEYSWNRESLSKHFCPIWRLC